MLLIMLDPMARPAPAFDGPEPAFPFPTSDPAEDEEVRRLILELLEMALDIAGIFDPTPLSDSASACLALSQGRWFDAAISGASIIPYVGDLAKAGKLPRWLRTVDRAIGLSQRSKKIADALRPALERLDQVLDWIPSGNNPWIMNIKQRVRGSVPRRRSKVKPRDLPDVREQYKFHKPKVRGQYVYRVAEGRLGVPGRVKRHRKRGAQTKVNQEHPGDDAGHFFGDRFGPTGDVENLSAQNWEVNQKSYRYMEDGWAKKLKKGYGIKAKVIDVTRVGESRPFMRRVEWIETSPTGKRGRRQVRTFSNPDSAKAREKRGWENPFPEDHQAKTYDWAKERQKRGLPTPGDG